MRIRGAGGVHHLSPHADDSRNAASARTTNESRTAHRSALAERQFAASMLKFRLSSEAGIATLSSRPSAARIRQLAFKHAPVFFLHPKEKYLPADPDVFIKNSSLRRPRTAAHRGRVPPITLAEQGEVRAGSLRGVRSPRTYLDLEDSKAARRGDPANAPVLYQFQQGPPPTMTYWLFSNYNNKAINKLPDQNHEGDWERVSVVYGNGIDRDPTEVRYSAHNGGTSLSWRDAPKDEAERPLVNVALGSHAMSPYLANQPTGVPGINDNFAVGGLRFDSRSVRPSGANRLEDVTQQPWWGTNVTWGEFGIFPFTSGITGPEPRDASGKGRGAVGPTDRHARKSAADQLAEEALAHPFASKQEILRTLRSLPERFDLRDELSQDFVEVLARRGKLDNYAIRSFVDLDS